LQLGTIFVDWYTQESADFDAFSFKTFKRQAEMVRAEINKNPNVLPSTELRITHMDFTALHRMLHSSPGRPSQMSSLQWLYSVKVPGH